jgi:hypothetical protein
LPAGSASRRRQQVRRAPRLPGLAITYVLYPIFSRDGSFRDKADEIPILPVLADRAAAVPPAICAQILP